MGKVLENLWFFYLEGILSLVLTKLFLLDLHVCHFLFITVQIWIFLSLVSFGTRRVFSLFWRILLSFDPFSAFILYWCTKVPICRFTRHFRPFLLRFWSLFSRLPFSHLSNNLKTYCTLKFQFLNLLFVYFLSISQIVIYDFSHVLTKPAGCLERA